jgi:3-phenylpropionate/trans-cinnamate dioxygenase ferredoxin reductase component
MGVGRSPTGKTDPLDRVVVVGASLAGTRAAEALRREGFTGRLTLVGDEAHQPYDRPPLSKQFLAGTWDEERIRLRVGDELDAEWRLGVRAVGLDTGAREVELAGGERVPYDGLVIATGAAPRTLPGVELEGVFVLRTLDDSIALKKALAGATRVAVLGAGFIGCEVAATCRGLGLEAARVDIFDHPLFRVLGAEMGAVCGRMHAEHGAELHMGVASERIEGDGGRATGITLADGTFVAAEVVVVGIGVTPATEWLAGSGLTIDDGVVCDETCAAIGVEGVPIEGVVAAGDLARWTNPLFGRAMRLEHWTNAAEQADHAAARLWSGPEVGPFAPVPYFWSDQYDAKIQLVGIPGPDVQVLEGSVEERKFVAGYGEGGRLVGALGFSSPRRLMQYRALVEQRAPFPPT